MVKKIVLGSLFVGFIGVLIYGAILRTNAKTSSGSAEGHGADTGLGRGRVAASETTDAAVSRGQGRNQTERTTNEPLASIQSERVSERRTVEGTVVSIGAEAMVVELADGHQLLVEGQPWLYAQTQSFAPQVGHQLVMQIFEEDDELKPGQIDNLSNGETVTLRLENGQPMWSGSLQNNQGLANRTGQGQGRGNGGEGQGNRTGEPANASIPTADALSYQGVVVTTNSTELVIETDAHESVVVEGRAWAYALAQGIAVQVGHTVVIIGFVEDGEFKAISIKNLTTGQQIAVRDANGRPLWSGGRRGGA